MNQTTSVNTEQGCSAGNAKAGQEEQHGAASPDFPDPSLAALAVIARLHHVAADPAVLKHQLGLGGCDAVTQRDLLRAARGLGLKAKAVTSSTGRLTATPLPAREGPRRL